MTMVDEPELDHDAQVEDVIDKMTTEFLQCRKLGHSWRTYDAKYFPDDHLYEEYVRCSSCKGVKTLFMNEAGEYFEAPKYDMKEGYRTKGIGRLSGHDREKVRITALQRFIKNKEDRKKKK